MPRAFKRYFSLLLTKVDIQSMFTRLETAHKADMKDVKAGLHYLTDRLESIVQPAQTAIMKLQYVVTEQQYAIQSLYKHVEDLEDRGVEIISALGGSLK